jgi:isopentenyl-diphosphate delta-isomerase
MTDELVDYFDAEGGVLGYCSRGEAEDKNFITPNAIIFVIDQSGEVLLQKRAQTKKHYPGLWDTSACGAIAHGENPEMAAERELFEEIGVRCKLQLAERFMNAFPSEDGTLVRTRLSYLYIGRCAVKPTHNHEVEEIRGFAPEGLLAHVKAAPEKYVPSFELELSKALAAFSRL